MRATERETACWFFRRQSKARRINLHVGCNGCRHDEVLTDATTDKISSTVNANPNEFQSRNYLGKCSCQFGHIIPTTTKMVSTLPSSNPSQSIKQEPLNVNWLDSCSNATGFNNNRNRSNYSNMNRTTKFKGNCNNCNKFGHKEAECNTKAPQ